MLVGKELSKPLAPIFILADDEQEAVDRMMSLLGSAFFYIPVTRLTEAVKYAKQFATTAVFLAEPINYPRGGAARLLQELLDETGKPVVILSEDWHPGVARKWKRMGAIDCIPHPTRMGRRMECLRGKMQNFALQEAD
jgi:FixJ family two-component response regulator